MNNFSNLNPKNVWNIFEEILTVPRPSKKEELIRKFLLDFANKNNLKAIVDKKGNVVIVRQPDKGLENVPTIVLQSHMDMVCEKDAEIVHDFLKDPIVAYIEDGWVKAKGTTLGADCGIGMAIQLAVLIETNMKTPKIEALFTVDEEQGLSGAMELDKEIITGKFLINLDSEDEGEIFIGCAGGIDTIATFDVQKKPITKDKFLKIIVSGLLGGHSGDDIEKGRACANKLLARTLNCLQKFEPELIDIQGGNLRNAIARDAFAVIAVDNENAQEIFNIIENVNNDVINEYCVTDPNVKIEVINTCVKVLEAIDKIDAKKIIDAIRVVPHGVVAWSATMKGLVETSTNLASVKANGGEIVVVTSQRSSIESAKKDIANVVETTFKAFGAKVVHSDGYPGWKPNPDAELVKIAHSTYKQLFEKEPIVKAIHAGLECGLILEKYPNMQAISIGPTIEGVHSPSEKIDVHTVEIFWEYLLKLIENLKN